MNMFDRIKKLKNYHDVYSALLLEAINLDSQYDVYKYMNKLVKLDRVIMLELLLQEGKK